MKHLCLPIKIFKRLKLKKNLRHLNLTFQSTNFIKFLQVLQTFQKLLASHANFVKLFEASSSFMKVDCESRELCKVFGKFYELRKRLVLPKVYTFHVRFDRLTFLENLYTRTTLTSGGYLQCFCIATTCL